MIQDPAPIYGNAYYRLRFTSFKKESGVSNIVSVQYDAPPSALYINKVEPNPFSENFSVSYGSQSKTDMEVKLTSISGKVVYREMLRPESGIENVYQFKDSKQLLPGIYFFSLSQDDEQKTVKLIKRLWSAKKRKTFTNRSQTYNWPKQKNKNKTPKTHNYLAHSIFNTP